MCRPCSQATQLGYSTFTWTWDAGGVVVMGGRRGRGGGVDGRRVEQSEQPLRTKKMVSSDALSKTSARGARVSSGCTPAPVSCPRRRVFADIIAYGWTTTTQCPPINAVPSVRSPGRQRNQRSTNVQPIRDQPID